MTPHSPTRQFLLHPANLVGVALFVFVLGFALWFDLGRRAHERDWAHIEAEVIEVVTLCDVQHKPDKYWYTEATVACDEAQAWIDEHLRTGEGKRNWRSIKTDYARIAYEAAGRAVEVRVPVAQVSAGPIAAGTKIPVLVDPAAPEMVEGPYSSTDRGLFWILCAAALGLWALMAAVGWFAPRLSAR